MFPSTDGQTDGQGETSISPISASLKGGTTKRLKRRATVEWSYAQGVLRISIT